MTAFFYRVVPVSVFLCLNSISVLAQEAQSDVATNVARSSSLNTFSMMNLLNMFMGLAIVIALILGLAWVLKKYGKIPSNNLVDMKVLGGLSLGTREKAVLVEVENTRLLIGVTPGHIQTLHVLDGEKKDLSSFDKTLNQQMEKADD